MPVKDDAFNIAETEIIKLMAEPWTQFLKQLRTEKSPHIKTLNKIIKNSKTAIAALPASQKKKINDPELFSNCKLLLFNLGKTHPFMKEFEKFCGGRLISENLDFLLAVDNYNVLKSGATRDERYEAIYSSFINVPEETTSFDITDKDYKPKIEVNISGSQKKTMDEYHKAYLAERSEYDSKHSSRETSRTSESSSPYSTDSDRSFDSDSQRSSRSASPVPDKTGSLPDITVKTINRFNQALMRSIKSFDKSKGRMSSVLSSGDKDITDGRRILFHSLVEKIEVKIKESPNAVINFHELLEAVKKEMLTKGIDFDECTRFASNSTSHSFSSRSSNRTGRIHDMVTAVSALYDKLLRTEKLGFSSLDSDTQNDITKAVEMNQTFNKALDPDKSKGISDWISEVQKNQEQRNRPGKLGKK